MEWKLSPSALLARRIFRIWGSFTIENREGERNKRMVKNNARTAQTSVLLKASIPGLIRPLKKQGVASHFS